MGGIGEAVNGRRWNEGKRISYKELGIKKKSGLIKNIF
jgi:hypothetical protein